MVKKSVKQQTPGEQFRAEFLEAYEGATVASTRLLAVACRTLDEIDELERVIEAEGWTVPGSRGQLMPHPLLRELRAHRELFVRLVAQLEPSGSGSRTAGSALARQRWSR